MENLNESVKNLIGVNSNSIKKLYIDQVWDILQKSYASQGGIKGNGFKNKEDMLTIPFWKLDIVDGIVMCVLMYKFTPTEINNKSFRKLCALGINDETLEIKKLARTKLRNILKYEFERSLMEVSGLLENYLIKNFPIEYEKYLIPVKEVEKILYKDDIIELDKYRYYRIIGDEYYEKVMLGSKKLKY